jgi:hypothetical protein
MNIALARFKSIFFTTVSDLDQQVLSHTAEPIGVSPVAVSSDFSNEQRKAQEPGVWQPTSRLPVSDFLSYQTQCIGMSMKCLATIAQASTDLAEPFDLAKVPIAARIPCETHHLQK